MSVHTFNRDDSPIALRNTATVVIAATKFMKAISPGRAASQPSRLHRTQCRQRRGALDGARGPPPGSIDPVLGYVPARPVVAAHDRRRRRAGGGGAAAGGDRPDRDRQGQGQGPFRSPPSPRWPSVPNARASAAAPPGSMAASALFTRVSRCAACGSRTGCSAGVGHVLRVYDGNPTARSRTSTSSPSS